MADPAFPNGAARGISPQEKVRTYLEVQRVVRRYGPPSFVRAVLVLQVEIGGGGTTCGSLARLLGLTSGATTRAVDAGEELGWLERYAGPDRREVWVRLTPLGEALAQHILESLSEAPAPSRISVMPLP